MLFRPEFEPKPIFLDGVENKNRSKFRDGNATLVQTAFPRTAFLSLESDAMNVCSLTLEPFS
jgi:hypothetical protein